MLKLLITPDEGSYSVTEDATVIESDMKGGTNRYRRDVLNAAIKVEVQFTVGPEEYQYLRAFYNVNDKGAAPFLIDLLIETADLRTYVAHFKPGTWKLGKVNGQSYQVKVTLEVQPNDDGLDYANIVDNFVQPPFVAPPPPGNFGGE